MDLHEQKLQTSINKIARVMLLYYMYKNKEKIKHFLIWLDTQEAHKSIPKKRIVNAVLHVVRT